MFWLKVLAVAQVALLIKRHLTMLESDERRRLGSLVAKSKGRPTKNLSANEREEMLLLVRKLEPVQFGRDAAGHVMRAPWRRR
jgi:hypothetical protein